MPPEQNVHTPRIKWREVTWYSKLIAVILFVGTFLLAFYLGKQMGMLSAPDLQPPIVIQRPVQGDDIKNSSGDPAEELMRLYPLVATGTDPARLEKVNTEVESVTEMLENEELLPLEIAYADTLVTEGVPTRIIFYSNHDGVLRMMATHTGHETWSSGQTYYFDEAGKPLKYIDEVDQPSFEGADDNSYKREIVFGEDGQPILSQEIDYHIFAPEEVVKWFSAIQIRRDLFH